MHPSNDLDTLLHSLDAARRNQFFFGKRMDVQHFRMEQDYGKLKQWMLNRLTLGKGVVCGLRVSVDGSRLCVDPGLAIDGLGREVVVPVRQCIDPLTNDGGCCPPCCDDTGPPPPVGDGRPPQPDGDDSVPPTSTDPQPGAPGGPPVRPVPVEPRSGVFTLWVCYKECQADYQPVLVAECQSRQPCEAGTIVESFCLKVTPGVLPLQDPQGCDALWRSEPTTPPVDPSGPGDLTASPVSPLRPGTLTIGSRLGNSAVDSDARRAGKGTLRQHLCELFDGDCSVPEGDVCVPLAAVHMRDGVILEVDSCLVRPRVYSNARLFDMILCLIAKVDECCDGKEPPPPTALPMRVAEVQFLVDQTAAVVSVASPLTLTQIPIGERIDAIRIRFTEPFDAGAAMPTTPGDATDPNFKRHAVLVVPESGMLDNLPFVPGQLVVIDAHTLQFNQRQEPPYSRGPGEGWQKGRYRLFLAGDPDPAINRKAIVDTASAALDGEPKAPSGGAMSGDGSPGGDFTLLFEFG